MRNALLVSVLALTVSLALLRLTYRGLSHPEPLELAQVARNVSRGLGLTTDVGNAEEVLGSAVTPNRNLRSPDFRNPPLFPLALGFAFCFFGPCDEVVPLLSLLFHLLVVIAVFQFARSIASEEVAVLAAVGTLFSPCLLSASLNGFPASLSALLLLLATWSIAGPCSADTPTPKKRLLLCGLFLGLAGLSHYPLLPVSLLFCLSCGLFGHTGLRCSGLVLLATLVVLSPWALRNHLHSGSFFGSQRWQAACVAENEGTSDATWSNKPLTPAEVATSTVRHPRKALRRVGLSLLSLYQWLPRWVLEPFFPFFLLCPLVALPGNAADSFKRLVIGAFAIVLTVAVAGTGQPSTLAPMAPLCILVGVLAFDSIIRQAITKPVVRFGAEGYLPTPLFRRLLGVALIGVALPPLLLPLCLKVSAPGLPRNGGRDLRRLRADHPEWKVLLTDCPARAAWYGDVLALGLPATVQRKRGLVPIPGEVSGIYLTPALMHTGNRGELASWQRMYARLSYPEGFPKRVQLPEGAVLFLRQQPQTERSR